jgi:hypothetical protein
MVCHLVTAVEAEYQRGYEEAMDQTKGTRSLEELLKGNRGKVISLSQDYMQLKLNIGSYCALLWSIFGEQWGYYRKLLKLYRILDRESALQSGMHTPERFVHELSGPSSTTDAHSSGKTWWHPTSYQGQETISWCHFWNQSPTQCAMPSQSNAQLSQGNG